MESTVNELRELLVKRIGEEMMVEMEDAIRSQLQYLDVFPSAFPLAAHALVLQQENIMADAKAANADMGQVAELFVLQWNELLERFNPMGHAKDVDGEKPNDQPRD